MSSASEKDDKGMHLNLHPYVLPPGVLLFCHLAQSICTNCRSCQGLNTTVSVPTYWYLCWFSLSILLAILKLDSLLIVAC